MINLDFKKLRQSGNFTVEFAIVGIVFSLLLVFTSDLVVKFATIGKLDRMSFSAVSILKERTQFSPKHDIVPLAQPDIDNVYKAIEYSLKRTMGNFSSDKFGFVVEEQRFDSKSMPLPLVQYKPTLNHKGCVIQHTLDSMQDLSVKSSWGRRLTLYRVTVCYNTENWFGDLVGKNYTTVSSSSLIMGR